MAPRAPLVAMTEKPGVLHTTKDLCEELVNPCGIPADNAAAILRLMEERSYVLTTVFAAAPEYVVDQMLADAGLGEGSKGALALLIGTAAEPHVWKLGAAAAAEAEKKQGPGKGGNLKEKQEMMMVRWEEMGEYELPEEFDGVGMNDSNFQQLLACEVRCPPPPRLPPPSACLTPTCLTLPHPIPLCRSRSSVATSTHPRTT